MEFYPYYRYGDTHPVPEMHIDQVEFFTAGMDRDQEVSLLKDIEAKMSEQTTVDLAEFKERFEDLKKVRNFVGEDYTFSNRLKAMGIKIFIWPNATITHLGIQGWTGNFDKFLHEKSEEKKKATETANDAKA